MRIGELPTKCCKVTKYSSNLEICNKDAVHWYNHNGDICSYCAEHNYMCGEPININYIVVRIFERRPNAFDGKVISIDITLCSDAEEVGAAINDAADDWAVFEIVGTKAVRRSLTWTGDKFLITPK